MVDLRSEDAPSLLRRACEGSGFAVLEGHGVPQSVVDDMRDAQKRFFAVSLPKAENPRP